MKPCVLLSRLIEYESASLKQSLSELINSSPVFVEFSEVWERIGLTVPQRQGRKETLALHVNNLLKEILQEEHELEKSMISSLQANEMELASLCEQLQLPIEKV